MTGYLINKISDKDVITRTQRIFSSAVQVAKELGYEYCAYGIKAAIPIVKDRGVLFSNYPVSWQDIYDERGYIEIDPAVRYALLNSAPLAWTQKTFETTPHLWADMERAGLHSGWIQSHRVGIGVNALFTVARGSQAVAKRFTKFKRVDLIGLSHLVHKGISKYLAPQFTTESCSEMTKREKEVLKWTALGKTASEIGKILSIADSTVNFHVANVIKKMAVINKTQAAVKATALGLIF
ncbi:autoinducer binding domain-containing protein [Glaciimonas immobilis]|uniref:DNA-binding CsgD family transcriptional regulator n=1 Tax=Glaciimonas immobilis TaxID=728004 RepID=A0A840RS64_9BURK|nr:autoinducer binding domain-containing protein [Glaciimonas immobilis]KAF3997136.1 LuxR family transcriptional regulator [Glaciimonas immobilis]MBB5200002.1 DNA-binding CsgD family transcriptional regulator [Glaciimonas immobilis]